MIKRILIALGVGLLVGTGAGLVWGPRVGLSVGILIAVAGTVLVVLRRNQQDLEELKRGGVPDEVEAALGEERAPPPGG